MESLERYTYLIMDESQKHKCPVRTITGADTYYVLDGVGVRVLIDRAADDEMREYIKASAERLIGSNWAYNMLYVLKMACGHYEVFQTRVCDEVEAKAWLKLMTEESKKRECTECVLHMMNTVKH